MNILTYFISIIKSYFINSKFYKKVIIKAAENYMPDARKVSFKNLEKYFIALYHNNKDKFYDYAIRYYLNVERYPSNDEQLKINNFIAIGHPKLLYFNNTRMKENIFISFNEFMKTGKYDGFDNYLQIKSFKELDINGLYFMITWITFNIKKHYSTVTFCDSSKVLRSYNFDNLSLNGYWRNDKYFGFNLNKNYLTFSFIKTKFNKEISSIEFGSIKEYFEIMNKNIEHYKTSVFGISFDDQQKINNYNFVIEQIKVFENMFPELNVF